MKRGRPIKSDIRQNIIEILNYLKRGYGYQIYKIYREIYPSCTREVIYYHLRKGVALGELLVTEVRHEKGSYSWGEDVEKIYYSLGPASMPRGDERAQKAVESYMGSIAASKEVT